MNNQIEREQQVRVLSDVPPGGRVCMVGFARHGRRARRLAELGMNPGTEIKVLQADAGQPIMLRVRGSQLAIDRREANHLFVTPLEPMPEPTIRGQGWRPCGRRIGFNRWWRNGRQRGQEKRSRQGLDGAGCCGEGNER